MSTAPYRQSSRTAYTRRKSARAEEELGTPDSSTSPARRRMRGRPPARAGRQSSRGRSAIATTASAASRAGRDEGRRDREREARQATAARRARAACRRRSACRRPASHDDPPSVLAPMGVNGVADRCEMVTPDQKSLFLRRVQLLGIHVAPAGLAGVDERGFVVRAAISVLASPTSISPRLALVMATQSRRVQVEDEAQVAELVGARGRADDEVRLLALEGVDRADAARARQRAADAVDRGRGGYTWAR